MLDRAARVGLYSVFSFFFLSAYFPSSSPADEIWYNQDLGSVGVAGASSFNEQTDEFTVQGSGANVGGTSDACQFVYQDWTGDGDLIARVTSVSSDTPWARVGLMIRESSAANARCVMLWFTPGTTSPGGLEVNARPATGANGVSNSGGSASTPVWLRMMRLRNNITTWWSEDGANWNFIRGYTAPIPSTALVGLFTCSRLNNTLGTGVFDNVSLTPLTAPGSPWTELDIGPANHAGASRFTNDVFSLVSSGYDISGTADAFHYLCQPWNGDGQAIVRMHINQGVDTWSKGGLMFRQSLTNNAVHASVFLSSGQGAEFLRRSSAGGNSTSIRQSGPAAPYWLKLIRTGNAFAGYQSPDGVAWSLVGTNNVAMTTNIFIGLAVSSKNTNNLNFTEFREFTLTPGTMIDNSAPTVPANVAVASKADTFVNLAWDASTDDIGVASYDIYRDATKIGSTTSTAYLDITPSPSTSHAYTLKALDLAGHESTPSAPLNVTTDAATLPSPWLHRDVGDVGVGGSAGYASGLHSIRGSGSDITGYSDAFHFAYRTLNGDGSIVARVESIQPTDNWAKAGLMMRETLDANSKYAMVLAASLPSNGINFQRRTTTGGNTSNTSGSQQTAPTWLKLTRSGNTITAYSSSDGSNWTSIGSQSIAMNSALLVGMAVTAHKNTMVNESVFSNVSLTGPDTDGDGMSNDWESAHNLDPDFNDASLDPDGDGLTNLQEFQQQTDPLDYYNGALPVLNILSGNFQTGPPNTFLADPLVVQVTNAQGQPLTNAPVTFEVAQGGGLLAQTESSPPAVSLSLRTDSEGKASLRFLLSPLEGEESLISVSASVGSQTVQTFFSAESTGTVVVPTFDPAGGTYSGPVEVTISCATPEAEVHYTLDGSDPTSSSTLYSGPITLSESLALKAKAFRSGWAPSGIAQADYTLPAAWLGAVVGGRAHSLYLDSDRKLWAWGDNSFGQLGTGTLESSAVPTQANGLLDGTMIAASGNQSSLLKTNNTVWAFGNTVHTPRQMYSNADYIRDGVVRFLSGSFLQYNVAGGAGPIFFGGAPLTQAQELSLRANILVLRPDGTVWREAYPSPAQQVPGLSEIVAIAQGNTHRLALKSDGTLWAWGRNLLGQLGIGTVDDQNHEEPVQVASLDQVKAIAAGENFSLALKTDGTLWAWGDNSYGPLGDGSFTTRNAPVQVHGVEDVGLLQDVRVIGTGPHHSLAIRADGSVLAWGRNDNGQLGDGGGGHRPHPVLVVFAPDQPVQRPTFSPAGGAYDFSQEVTISYPMPEAVIRYTLNGQPVSQSDPAVSSGSSVYIGKNLVLKAQAFLNGIAVGGTQSASYQILNPDSDGDTMLDAWETSQGLDPNLDDAQDDPDQDGLTNLQEYLGQTSPLDPDSDGDGVVDGGDSSPLDYYNGQLPVLEIVRGNFQNGPPNTFLVEPLEVRITNLAGQPLVNAPLTFLVSNGGGWVAASLEATPVDSVVVRSDQDGVAQVFFLTSPIPTASAQIHATVQTDSQTILTIFETNPDSDGDGLSDEWENRYFGGIGQWPEDDFDGDNLTNLQEYQFGTDPTATDTDGDGLADDGDSAPLDYYNGVSPVINVVSGNFQRGPPGEWIEWLTVQLTDSNGQPLANAPVSFAVVEGGGLVASYKWGADRDIEISLRTDSNGYASAAFLLPPIASQTCLIRVSAQTGGQTIQNFFTADTLDTLPGVSISPNGGAYSDSVEISLSCGDPDAIIRYEMGGPPGPSSPAYVGPLTLNRRGQSVTLHARAFREGWLASETTTAAFEIGAGTIPNIADVETFSATTLARDSQGRIWSWGRNDQRQLGVGTQEDCALPGLTSLASFAQIVCAENFAIGLKEDGTAWMWGANLAHPTQIAGLDNVQHVVVGYAQQMALKQDGTVWAWGQSYAGSLGLGTEMVSVDVPVQVPGLQNVQDLVYGKGDFGFALKADGTLWGWGANWFGVLGNGSSSSSPFPHHPTPAWIDELTGIVAASAGSYHAVFLKSDGTVWTTGVNTSGQLGNGLQDSSPIPHGTPVQVQGLTDVIAVQAGGYHNLALKSDGTVWAWGDNSLGQLGDSTTALRTIPTQVLAPDGAGPLTDIVSIKSGVYSCFALRSDGALFAWGYNGQGQLGDGTHVNRPLPVRVFQTPQPTLNPDGGTYTSITHVQCNNPVESGAEMHYTLNGEEPTQADPAVVPGLPIPVFGSTSLKIKAWKNGYLPSLTKTSFYDVQVTEENSGDNDDDGLPDLWEYQHFGSTSVDPNADSDGDGFLNYQEHHNGTNPNQVDPGAEQPTPVEGLEAIQRGLQKRYQAVDSRHQTLVFPTRSDGTAPPPLPPDGFYAMDSTNTVRMVALVQHLSDKLHNPEFLRRFVSADRGDLEDAKSLPVHGPATLPALPAITSENYLDSLTEIGVRLAKLRHPWMGSFNTTSAPPLWHTGEWVGLEYKGGWHANFAMHTYPAGTFESSEAFGQEVTAEVAEARSAIIAQADNACNASWQPHTQRQSYGGLLSQFMPGAEEYLFVSSGPADYYNDGSGFAQVDARAEKSAVRGKLQFDLSPFEGPVQLYIASRGWGGLSGPVTLDQRLHKLEENESGQVYTSNSIGDLETLPWLPTVLEGQGNSASWQMIHWVAVLTDDFAEPKVKIAVDANRDGEIEFEGEVDKTTSDRPFRFWCNEDNDIRHTVDQVAHPPGLNEEDDIDPTDPDYEGPDYTTNKISCKRDLEDFTRLHVKFSPDLDLSDGTWECRLQFTDVTEGSPGVNLWRAVGPGLEYLTVEVTANQQLNFTNPAVITASQETTVPIDLFDNPDKRAVILFEGRTPGKGALTVRFYKKNAQGIAEKVAEDKIYLDLKHITDMYERYSVGDGDVEPAAPVRVGDFEYGAKQTPDDENYILYVHGWNMPTWEKDRFAETMYKRLWHLGYKGRFGLFRWPTEVTDWVITDPRNYDRSEFKAWKSGAGLRVHLHALNNNYPGHVRVLAHSMGNVVTGEAMRLEATSPTPEQFVHTYVATQAAIPAHCYDPSTPEFVYLPNHDSGTPNVYASYPPTDESYLDRDLVVGMAGKYINYFNPEDWALANWRFNQQLKPDSGYDYLAARFLRLDQEMTFPNDRYEIFSFCAEARSWPVGADVAVGEAFSTPEQVNLQLNFGFSDQHPGHSAQFRSYNMLRGPYWETLMNTFDVN